MEIERNIRPTYLITGLVCLNVMLIAFLATQFAVSKLVVDASFSLGITILVGLLTTVALCRKIHSFSSVAGRYSWAVVAVLLILSGSIVSVANGPLHATSEFNQTFEVTGVNAGTST